MFCKGYDSGFVLDGKKIVGFGLGADATSEHEWGIRRLRGSAPHRESRRRSFLRG